MGNTQQGVEEDAGSSGVLNKIITDHMAFMKEQEGTVNRFISKQRSPGLLRAAKQKAVDNEKELMNQIKKYAVMHEFLNNIILIENLFNSFYTQQQRQQQQTARKTYAPNIQDYESKPKPVNGVESFMDLMFGTNVYMSAFKKWLQKVETRCTRKGIKMVSSSGAKVKNIERAFYKSFYVYAVKHGDQGFKQMTDVLRCSLVFDNFDALYQCFGVIEKLAKADTSIAGGILRVKDRYNPAKMPFGYRDMLINIYCPGSNVVCEIQLHHLLFYEYKKISHKMYKKARLFEDVETGENPAYKFADTEIRSAVGQKVYQLQNNDMDEEDEEDDDSDDGKDDDAVLANPEVTTATQDVVVDGLAEAEAVEPVQPQQIQVVQIQPQQTRVVQSQPQKTVDLGALLLNSWVQVQEECACCKVECACCKDYYSRNPRQFICICCIVLLLIVGGVVGGVMVVMVPKK